MALEIVWTKRATAGYDRIIANLERNWTKKEIRHFVIQTNTFLELLKQFPNLLEKSRAHQMFIEGQSTSLQF